MIDDDRGGPALRFESDDEFLGAVETRRRTAGAVSAINGSFRAVRPILRPEAFSRIRRFPRTLRAMALVTVVAVAGAWAGFATHQADADGAAAAAATTAATPVLRVLASTMSETRSGASLSTSATSITVSISFTLRVDSAYPIEVISATVSPRGVTTTVGTNDQTLQPGLPEVVPVQVSADCGRADLAEYPGTLEVRIRGKDARIRVLDLPVPPTAAAAPGQGQTPAPPGFTARNFFEACGAAANMTFPLITYLGLTAPATTAHPVFSYRLRVANRADQLATAITFDGGPDSLAAAPGFTYTSDLNEPVTLRPASSVTVTVTVHPDCGLLYGVLKGNGGYDQFSYNAEQTGLYFNQADPRFKSTAQHLDMSQVLAPDGTSGASTFRVDSLREMIAACPVLK